MYYWIYLILFILAILVPDIVTGGILFISENRLEELIIFILGVVGFLIFLINERKLAMQRKNQEKDQRRLVQTAKDLIDSYSYIGEVNRKMDMLMQIGLGLADRSILDKAKEKEIYFSILNAAQSLAKADRASLRFVNVKTGKSQWEVDMEQKNENVKNAELLEMGGNVNIATVNGTVIVSSLKEINSIRSYLIIEGHSQFETDNPNNQEILKYLSSQALFMYSYMHH